MGFSSIQACGSGVNGSFHDAAGKPLVNKTLFPDLKGMVATAKSKGVRMGWYVLLPAKQANLATNASDGRAVGSASPRTDHPIATQENNSSTKHRQHQYTYVIVRT